MKIIIRDISKADEKLINAFKVTYHQKTNSKTVLKVLNQHKALLDHHEDIKKELAELREKHNTLFVKHETLLDAINVIKDAKRSKP